MPETVIITSLLDNYVLSSCLLKTKYPDAKIIPTSRNGIHYHLERIIERNNAEIPKSVIIVAIPNPDFQQQVSISLRKLVRSGISISWICANDSFKSFFESIDDLTCQCSKCNQPIHETVSSRFNIRANSVLLRRIREIYGNTSNDNMAERILTTVKMAISRYIQFRDIDTFQKVSESLAVNGTVSAEFDDLLVEYEKYGHRELSGKSTAILQIKKKIKILGREGSCSVLITGDSGTGKETVAYQIHAQSKRSGEPFVPFNCADLNPNLIASRLFGHEKGAFTGAEHEHAGAFEQANGGTLFLDEVGELPLGVQAGLLRVLQEKRFTRIGGQEDQMAVDVRIIAATNRNLPEMVQKNAFREDLFYRLNEVMLHIPALKNRLEDIPEIVKFLSFQNFNGKRFTKEQLKQLCEYHWPGNVRELISILKRSVIFNESNLSKLIAEQQEYCANTGSEGPSDLLEDTVYRKALQVYQKNNENKTRTAQALGISINRLKRILQKRP